MTTPDPDREGTEGDGAGTPDPEPRAPLDVDTTFAAIVAHWADEDDDVSPPWPEQENLPRKTAPRDSSGPGGAGTGPGTSGSPGSTGTGTTSGTGPSDAGPASGGRATGSTEVPETPASEPRVIRPALPDPFTVPPSRAEASLEERFVPPEPPPLPRGDLFSRLAWAGVLGGPVFLLIAAMIWREAPQALILTAVGAFIGGFVALVVRLPEHHDDDDDDGAIV